jgi:hypothetical protein
MVARIKLRRVNMKTIKISRKKSAMMKPHARYTVQRRPVWNAKHGKREPRVVKRT